MSSTKLLILTAAVVGLLAGPSWGAEESEMPQAAEVALEPSVQPDETADTQAPAPDTPEMASSQEGDAVAGELPEAAEPEASAAAEAGSDLEGAEASEAPAPAGPVGVADGEASEIADAQASLEGAEASAVSDAGLGVTLEADADAQLPPAPRTTLGRIGYDSEGRRGWIHEVRPADTLWDISDAYLGTPWVWPSIWDDNRNIANPHIIEPGDLIWISPAEMRRVTPAEAEALLSNLPPEPAAAEEFGVALEEPELPVEPEVVPEIPVVPEERGTQTVANRENAGLIRPEQFATAATIVGSDAVRVLLSQEDEIFIGLGEGQVEAGDQFTIFRTLEKVFDPDTGALLGYHVQTLGWLEVEEVFPETAQARIRMSTGGIEVGDQLVPREPLPARIAVQESPQGVEGRISFFPHHRVLMGYNDFVYLNRGTNDGLQVGSPLEVYRVGYPARETARRKSVEVPDRVVAQLLVVRADEETSVALVTFAKTELAMGDHFRGAMP